jgi:hypothetical protein
VSASKIAYLDNVRESLANLYPEAVKIKQALLITAPPLYNDTVVIASANDGVHGDPSYHGVGFAYDVRYLSAGKGGYRTGAIMAEDQTKEAKRWALYLKMFLGRDYDVKVEGNHIHIERDAR